MADWPAPKQDDAPNPSLGGLTITPPAFDANEDNSKTVEQLRVEQQWRDVAEDGRNGDVAQNFPLSINRDAAEVTGDPYDQA